MYVGSPLYSHPKRKDISETLLNQEIDRMAIWDEPSRKIVKDYWNSIRSHSEEGHFWFAEVFINSHL